MRIFGFSPLTLSRVILCSEFCPSVCLQLVIYLRRCLNPPSLVEDPLVFLLFCILMMESLLADRY